jgi:hypothetical protein
VDYRGFSDDALLARLRELASRELGTISDFVACLAEADRRAGAILGEGYPSLFEFCVRDLKLAESTAYHRIKAAKLVRGRPEILSLLADGSINLSTLCLIAPRLAEHPALLLQIVGKTKREVEVLVASFGVPREIPDRVRPLPPATIPSGVQSAPFPPTRPDASPGVTPQPAVIQIPIATVSEPRTEFRFAAGPRFVEAVERLRALLWHKHPGGRLEDLLYEAANDFIARRDPAREPKHSSVRGTPSRLRRSRRIPAAVRREVWKRDSGACSFVGPAGRCGESRSLKIDHVTPWALGGASDHASNLRLLCRAHNQSEATRVFDEVRSLPG